MIYVGMGVPMEVMFSNDEPPTLLMQVCMANHPLILLTLMGWAIARATAAVAGEIERGTLDLTLTRPVRRSTYLAAQVFVAVGIFAVLALALMAGHLLSPRLFRLANPPVWTRYLPSILMLAGLGLAIFGYTLVLSARELSRARAGILGMGITLAGLAGLITAGQLEGYEWLSKLSVFEYFAPVGISMSWESVMSTNLGVLLGTFASGVALAFLVFLNRDLPTSG